MKFLFSTIYFVPFDTRIICNKLHPYMSQLCHSLLVIYTKKWHIKCYLIFFNDCNLFSYIKQMWTFFISAGNPLNCIQLWAFVFILCLLFNDKGNYLSNKTNYETQLSNYTYTSIDYPYTSNIKYCAISFKRNQVRAWSSLKRYIILAL